MHPQPELQRRVHFHATQRMTQDGRHRFGLVVQLIEVQQISMLGAVREVPSGATLVIDVDGRLRYIIASTPVLSRLGEIESAGRAALTNAMGWQDDGAAADPLGVSYRGMHEVRP
jgi:hypothetical protein